VYLAKNKLKELHSVALKWNLKITNMERSYNVLVWFPKK